MPFLPRGRNAADIRCLNPLAADRMNVGRNLETQLGCPARVARQDGSGQADRRLSCQSSRDNPAACQGDLKKSKRYGRRETIKKVAQRRGVGWARRQSAPWRAPMATPVFDCATAPTSRRLLELPAWTSRTNRPSIDGPPETPYDLARDGWVYLQCLMLHPLVDYPIHARSI